MSTQPDFLVTGGGTIYLVLPLTDAAREWIDASVAEDAPRFGRATAVEHRYIDDLVSGILADGLTVSHC